MNDLFKALFVLTVIILVSSAAFAIVAPSLGFDSSVVRQEPSFPVLPDLNNMGNQTAALGGGWAFSESHPVVGTPTTVFYKSFNTNKQVQSVWQYHVLPFSKSTDYRILRYSTWFIIVVWINEPITDMSGAKVGDGFDIPAQTIVNDFNGTCSTFNIDQGNSQYQAYVSFFPLSGYSNMVDSFNSGHGFQVWIYGNAYAKAGWMDEITSLLAWLGSVIGFFVGYAYWICLMSGLMVTALSGGLLPAALGSAIVILAGIVFVGGLLSFLRGDGGGK